MRYDPGLLLKHRVHSGLDLLRHFTSLSMRISGVCFTYHFIAYLYLFHFLLPDVLYEALSHSTSPAGETELA
jgi:hypothetical protein